MEPCVFPVFILPVVRNIYVWKSSFSKSLVHNRQEYYLPTIYKAGAAVSILFQYILSGSYRLLQEPLWLCGYWLFIFLHPNELLLCLSLLIKFYYFFFHTLGPIKKQQHCLPLQRSVKFKASTQAKENFA